MMDVEYESQPVKSGEGKAASFRTVACKVDRLRDFELLVIIAVLELGEKAYGMNIRRRIAEKTGREVAIGAVYTALDRLEKKGFVGSWLADPTPQRGGRAKKFFRLEAAGEAASKETLSAMAKMARGVELNLGLTEP